MSEILADSIKEWWNCCITKEMPHNLYVNDWKCRFIDARRFTINYDNVVAVSLSFTLIENDCVDLKTFAPLTLVLCGVTHTLAANEEFTLALGQDVYIPLLDKPGYATKLRVAKGPPESAVPHPTPDAVMNLRWHVAAAREMPREVPREVSREVPREVVARAAPKKKRRRVHEFYLCY
jgi:hypothetical protein